MQEQQREWVSLNGELLPAEEARVSVFDSGFMQGIGLFETMRTYFGRVFRLDEHIARLRASAEALDWAVVPETDTLVDCIDDVVAATDVADARVRLTVTTGTMHSSDRDTPELTIVVSAAEGAKYPKEMYESGVSVALCDYRHNRFDPTVGHKTTSYFSRLAALREAYQKQALETLWFTHDGRLAEGSISNVFLVHDQKLSTPPLGVPVLPGVTRAVVIELARQLEIEVEERELTFDDLRSADEVLLTNSLMEVMPVVRIEREPIGNEKPGPMFLQLREAYEWLVRQECEGGEEEG